MNGATLRSAFSKTPPKKHDKDPAKSEIVAHIQSVIGGALDRAVKAFNSMRNKNSKVLVFDFPHRVWMGCDWEPSDADSKEDLARRRDRALERKVDDLASEFRKLRKEFRKVIRAVGKSGGKESGEPSEDVPQAPAMGCNPGIQSREFAKLFEKEREEARCMKAAERLEETGPRRWLGCCDGCGYLELIGTEYPYECGECGLPYTERGG